MQSVAVISDIHANLPALEAVLEEIDGLGIEHILCCGDIVGYGPHPRECVELIRQRKIPSVLGTFHHYLRHKGRLPLRLANKPEIIRKWEFIAWMAGKSARRW